ncbi:MAG TPA: TIGR01777 family oxidoreductase [Candidatus Bathyarchaeia archaeon]|nr:TIGR01777 family oxidoreductase [Candidatus Bathyarchaeia archaeon]
MNRRIVLAGGSGFIGSILAERLAAHNYEVAVLTRSPHAGRGAARQVVWDGRTLGDWTREVDGATALINLSGRSVNCRYIARNRRDILESRVDSTRVLGEAIARSGKPPPVWLNASTATIYKHTYDREMDEATGEIGATPEAKDAFSIEVACAWERTLNEAQTPATRKVALRTAMVFAASEGGVYRTLRSLTRWGLGGSIAGGRQFISWIHEADFCDVIEWLIDHDDFSGPVNLASPNPIPQRDMMRIIRRECGVPFGLPATRRMLEIAAFVHRTEAELIIKSRRVVPARLLSAGFQFYFPNMEDAVHEIEDRVTRSAI